MLKKKLLTIITVAMLVITGSLALTGCSKKESVTPDKFETKAESLGFKVNDITLKNYKNYDYVDYALQAVDKNDSGCEVEFIVAADSTYASKIYASNKASFESAGAIGTDANSVTNYDAYTAESGGRYRHLCRINNTIVFVDVLEKYKSQVDELLTAIGY